MALKIQSNFGGWHWQVGNDCRQAFGAPSIWPYQKPHHFGDKPGERARKKVRETPPTPRLPTTWRSPTPTTHTARLHAVSPVARRPPCSIDLPPHPVPCFGYSNLARADLRSLRHGARPRCSAVHAGMAWQHTLLIPRVCLAAGPSAVP
jgi:hypothetical protein